MSWNRRFEDENKFDVLYVVSIEFLRSDGSIDVSTLIHLVDVTIPIADQIIL